MAIIVDPDNLDRNQIIFGTTVQQMSFRDVGSLVSSALNLRTDSIAASGSYGFTGSSAVFTTWGVVPGSVLSIFTGLDAGHWVVKTVDSATTLTVDSTYNLPFSGSAGGVYSVFSGSGGSIVDGLTEQAAYSFAKEEWRTDTGLFGGDNLIRYPFPFEAITREQMEAGGGTAHANWTYNERDREYSKKKVRTGGWAKKNTAATTLDNYSGIITLGSVDSNAQVYYQQLSASANPTNFTFLGPVNEPILTYRSGGIDSRTYLKLFVRKKYRTYAGSSISDIGVTSLETIVNRFPLQHATDAAITNTDGEIIGNGTFRNQSASLATGVAGVKTVGQTSFFNAGSTFVTNGVSPGDTLRITSGNEQGYHTIANVQQTSVTCSTDADFTSWGQSESSLTFAIASTAIYKDRVNGTIVNVNQDTGTLSASVGNFTGKVSPGDMVIITSTSSVDRGVYKVSTVTDNNILTLNTTDHRFPVAPSGAVDYTVVKPGMYLQYKQDNITLGSYGTLTFSASAPPTIARSAGSWLTDTVTSGTILTVAGTTNNNKSFTVKSRTALTATLVPTDVVVNESAAAATLTAYDPFKRTIAGEIYGFHWRLFGISETLANAYQFVQHQLRQTTDIDFGPNVHRGDVTDLLMTYASPTGRTADMYIDNLSALDTNNVTYVDATGVSRLENYVAAGSIQFNTNLQTDANAVYTMFFTNDDAGNNFGYDYGTINAIVVKDSLNANISGSVAGQPSVSFTYDYDNNTQRGAASAGTDAPVTIVAIGLNTAQFVIAQGTIARSKSNNFAMVSALERNYNNPV